MILKTREEVLESIHPDMELTKDFLCVVYYFAVFNPGFEDIALRELAKAGFNQAEELYEEAKREVDNMSDDEISARFASNNPAVCDNGVARPIKQFKPIRAITAEELDKEIIPPIEWIVEDILTTGLSMLGAPSKSRKSYMALDLCVSVCTGGKFLGLKCQKSACLYFDLESTRRRPKNRLNQIMGEASRKPDNLFLITGSDDPGRVGDGFETQVEHQLKEHPEIKLVVVDVFQLIRKSAKKNQTGYDRDYDDFKILKQLTDKHNIGILLIHHTRKMRDPSDVFNNLSGSVGVMGALDCAFVISKEERNDTEATFSIIGRDIKPQELKIRFNEENFKWERLGSVEEVQRQRLLEEYKQSPVVEVIRKLVTQGGGRWGGTISDIKKYSFLLIKKEIYLEPEKIGVLIRRYQDLFLTVDGIDCDFRRGARGVRKCVFTATSATAVFTATAATTATQLKFCDV